MTGRYILCDECGVNTFSLNLPWGLTGKLLEAASEVGWKSLNGTHSCPECRGVKGEITASLKIGRKFVHRSTNMRLVIVGLPDVRSDLIQDEAPVDLHALDNYGEDEFEVSKRGEARGRKTLLRLTATVHCAKPYEPHKWVECVAYQDPLNGKIYLMPLEEFLGVLTEGGFQWM